MAYIDIKYKKLVEAVLRDGFNYLDQSRAGINMLQIPHYTLEIDMRRGPPLLTTKKVSWKTVAHELIWMLSGADNIKYLQDNGVKIWDKDAAILILRVTAPTWVGYTGPNGASGLLNVLRRTGSIIT